MSDLKSDLARLAHEQGFLHMGIAAATVDDEARALTRARVARGDFSGLPWFDAARVIRAADPERSLPGARSVIVLAASYAHSEPAISDDHLRGRVSRYAWGRDYHRVLEKRARSLLARIAERVPGARSRLMIDHGPLLERAFARRAGLGWQGKNAMIFSRAAGSYAFLAEILTTAELEPDPPLGQHCGSCTRCLPACPTGALRADYEVVSDLCVSYQTIENRGTIPRGLRPKMGDWVFGCDLCQEVCPVNDRRRAPGLPEFAPPTIDDARPDLVELLALDERGFRQRFAGKPILRAKVSGLMRNACVALGNLGDSRAVPALIRALFHFEPLVRGHAAWALGRLGASSPLHARLELEPDPWVRDEILAALVEERTTRPTAGRESHV